MKTKSSSCYSSRQTLAGVVGLMLLAGSFLFQANAALGLRPPGPPLPDTAQALWGERFDEAWGVDGTNALVTVGQFQFAASWSGYAMHRSGTVVPFTIPGIDDLGHTNVSTLGGGGIRFWVRPLWPSGIGPGTYARLADMNVIGESAALWSLQVTPDGSAVSLVAQSTNGPLELLTAPISWGTDLSHLVCLNYTPEWTELYLDGWLVAEGPGILSVPSILTRLTLGSAGSGAAPIEGDIDEAYTFARPLLDFEVAFHYTAYRRQVSSWAAANSSTLLQSSSRLATSDGVMESASNPLPPGPGEGGYGTNNVPQDPGPPPYELNGMLGFLHPILTSSNLTLIITNIDSSAVYDIYYTTNLALLPAPALCATNWAWLGRTTPGQTNFVWSSLPQPECYFILGTQFDFDGDGLPDAWENLTSHTPTNAIDVVSHDGIPDGWLMLHGFVPPSNVGNQDPDADALINRQEYLWGTDPYYRETFRVWLSVPSGAAGIP
jgi:hypothetical protein